MKRFFGMLLLVLFTVPAYATSVPFQLTLHVTGFNQTPGCLFPLHALLQTCGEVPFETYIGSFTIDDSALHSMGDNLSIPVSHFLLTMGGVTWNQDDFFSDFNEFTNTRFDIHAGMLNVRQLNVAARGDVPFIDFVGNNWGASDSKTVIVGTFTTTPIPEPATVFLLIAGLGLLLALLRDQQGQDPKRKAR